jgi:lipopolysaccharide export LptBFGC system permease protein LptF
MNATIKANDYKDAIIKYFENTLYFNVDLKSGDTEQENTFKYDVLTDAENAEVKAGEDAHEQWKAGNIRLYNNYIVVSIQEVKETNFLIEDLNFKKFTINQILDISQDIDTIRTYEENDAHEIKNFKNEPLTVSEHETGNISKGSENLYFEFKAYILDPKNKRESDEVNIHLYTKDDHDTLKAIIGHYTNQL